MAGQDLASLVGPDVRLAALHAELARVLPGLVSGAILPGDPALLAVACQLLAELSLGSPCSPEVPMS